MDGNHITRFFLEPEQALRAVFVAAEPLDQVATRFGYTASTLRSMASRFRATWDQGITPPFFAPTVGDDLPARVPAHINRAPIRRASVIAGN